MTGKVGRVTMIYKILLLLACWLVATLSIKILSINNIKKDDKFAVTIKEPGIFNSSEFSVCWWLKTIYHTSYVYMGSYERGKNMLFYDYHGGGKSFFITFNSDQFGSHSIEVPKGQEIIPHSWTFFCIMFDNEKKTLIIYLNSEVIHKQTGIENINDFKLETDFVKENIQFSIGAYSGNLTGLMMWSTVLTKEDVKSLYTCSQGYPEPDIIDWEKVEFDISPETENIELKDIVSEDEPCKERIEALYLIKIPAGMDKKREAIRMCNALGGELNALKNLENIQKFEYKDCPGGQDIWVPVFRDGNRWIDNKGYEVTYLPWSKNQLVNPDKNKCVVFYDNEYFTEQCHINHTSTVK